MSHDRPVLDPELVGRAAELARVHALLSETMTGAGGCAVLTGAPGIGKTRLLVAAHRQARELGLAVAPGRAIELDRAAPLRSLLSAVGAAEPVPVELAALQKSSGDQLWYVDRLGEALEEYVARRPLLVLVDDAHWCDELSALALRVLVPRLSSSPLRWLLTRRPVPVSSPGQEAIGWLLADGAEELRLGPLDEEAVRELCAHTLDAEPDATVLALAARSKGNPFLLEQYLTALKATGQVLVSAGVASVVGADLPSSFLYAVDQRLRGLSAEARRLLQAGSVFGRPFTVHEAAWVLGAPAATLVQVAEEAVSAGLLLEQGSVLAFAHDLLQQAMYDNLSGSARATMHREAAAVMREEGGAPVEIAEHLVRAGQRGDRAAVATLRAAAEQVAARAPSAAADLVVHALRMLAEHDPQGPELGAEAVQLLAAAGRVSEALELGERTLRGGLDVRTRASLLLGLVQTLKHAGRNRSAVEYARRALADPAVPAEIQARLYAIEAHALLYASDLPGVHQAGAEADRLGAEADRLGTATGESAASSVGNAARSLVASADGRFDDAVGYASRAVEVVDKAGGVALHQHPRIWLGSALAALDRFDEAEQAYTLGRHKAEELGSAWSLPLYHYYNASLRTARGQLDEAVADAEAGVRIAEQLAALAVCVPLLGLLARLAVLRGQLPVAREHLRRMNKLRADGITCAPEDVFWPIACVQFADGQPAAAVTALHDLYRWLPDRMLLFSYDAGIVVGMVRIALAAGDPVRARVTAEAAALLAQRNPSVSSLGAVAAHADGLVRRDIAALRRAVDLFRDSPRPLARVSALEDTAKAEQDSGHRDRAIQLLHQAIEEATRCGALGAVQRMTKQLLRLGVQAEAEPQSDRGPVSPLAGLTAMELNIAQLVANGLTNAQIAERFNRSPHTIDSHLRKIFAKLGVNSRIALTRIVLENDQPG